MYTNILENDALRIEINEKGAELARVYDKKNGRDVLYNADPFWWNRHAPVLFPFVGNVKGGRYTAEGKEYAIGQHGFARDLPFENVSVSSSKAVQSLCSSDTTKAKYPYDFRFTVTHELEGNTIHIIWTVESFSDPMYFKVGAHPAFVLPILPDTKLEDYYLSLNGRSDITYRLIAPGQGIVDESVSYPLETPDGFYPLSEKLFEKDALIIDGQLDTVGLALPDKTPYITVTFPGFPNLGIWKKPGAPFVCLEPWYGRTDNTDSSAEISEKAGMICLKKGEAFTADYRITVE